MNLLIACLLTLLANEVTKSAPAPCTHISCNPSLPEIKKPGRIIVLRADGIYKPQSDFQAFRAILKRAGWKTEADVIRKGKEIINYFLTEFGVNFNSVVTDQLLLGQGGSRGRVSTTTADQEWKFEIGVMGFEANIHVISEITTDENGKSSSRVPDEDVRIAFAFYSVECLNTTCKTHNKTVPRYTKATMDVSASDEAAAKRGWDVVYYTTKSSFFAGLPPSIIHRESFSRGIASPKYGKGTLNGMFSIDGTNRPNMAMKYSAVAAFSDWVSGARSVSASLATLLTTGLSLLLCLRL